MALCRLPPPATPLLAPLIASSLVGLLGVPVPSFVVAVFKLAESLSSLLPSLAASRLVFHLPSRTATLTLAPSIASTPGTPGLPAPRPAALVSSLATTRLMSLPSTVATHAPPLKSACATPRPAPLMASFLLGLATLRALSLAVLAPRPSPVL